MSRIATAVVIGIITFTAAAAEPNSLTPKEKLALGSKLASAFVRVEYTLKYDQADAPEIYGWQKQDGRNSIELLRDERFLERPGYLIAPDLVATPDVIYDRRFLNSIRVSFGSHSVPAHQKAWSKNGTYLLLQLEKPVEGMTPLKFDTSKDPAFFVATGRFAGQWGYAVFPFDNAPYRVESGDEYCRTGEGLILAQDGTPIGVSLGRELPADDSWKGSPAEQPLIRADEMAALEKAILGLSDRSILLARLNFRSPRSGSSFRSTSDDTAATELFCPAIVIDPNRALILASLNRDNTSRLERITIESPDGKNAVAKFAVSLRDYGAFVATLDTPYSGAASLADADITSYRNKLLPAVNVRVRGANRVSRFCHVRFASFVQGLKGALRPEIDDAPECFIFDHSGNLISMPISRRLLFEKDSSRGPLIPQQIPSATIRSILNDLTAHIDTSNVPVTEEEENRLAWLGVELQALDADLARENNVSQLTNEGDIGAIVSYVYPGSPAAEAGIEPGTVLLRIRIPGRPLPIEIRQQDDDLFDGGFPWDRLDEIPEQYFDEIPKPWPGVDSLLNKILTDIGFGKDFTLDYVQDGKEKSVQMVVTAGPLHYDSAPRYQDAALGITVRDLTYEVMRYFQRNPQDGGVIVSKVEPGSRASVTGIRPYEIITHINDRPVMSASNFEELTKGQKELRISVKRMMRGRVVKITLD